MTGCAAQLDLQPADFLANRLPTNPKLEVDNDAYKSVTSGFEPRREVEPEPWKASSDKPSPVGGNG